MLRYKYCLVLCCLTLVAVSDMMVTVTSAQAKEDGRAEAQEYFTDLALVTQEGRNVNFYSDVLEDRIVLIGGFYTHCATACPMQMKVLSQLQALLQEKMKDSLGRDLFIVSITLDPERDNLEKLKSYSDRYSKGPGWLFLTGEKENVNWINYRLGQYSEVVERHTSYYLLGNLKTGQWVRIQPNANPQQLMQLLQDQIGPS